MVDDSIVRSTKKYRFRRLNGNQETQRIVFDRHRENETHRKCFVEIDWTEPPHAIYSTREYVVCVVFSLWDENHV